MMFNNASSFRKIGKGKYHVRENTKSTARHWWSRN